MPSTILRDSHSARDQESIIDPAFVELHRHRPFALVSPGFAQVDSVDPPVEGAYGLVRTTAIPAAPFVAVELNVAALDAVTVAAGLTADNNDHVLVTYDARRNSVTIELRLEGRKQVLKRVDRVLTAPLSLAFVLCENRVTALVNEGDGWQPVTTCRAELSRHVDLRRSDTLNRFTYAYGVMGEDSESVAQPTKASRFGWLRLEKPVSPRAPGDGYCKISDVRAGPFGMAGVRDPHLVQRPDGTPYTRDGLLYLTFTCAGLGFFQQAHWGVFTLDPNDPTRLEQVAHLYFARDGFTYGDHAGQIIRDEENDEFIVVVSSWGDFSFNGVHVRHTTTGEDILSGVHVLNSAPLPLPTEHSSWDPALTRIKDRWYVGFVESPSQGDTFDFHPALAVGKPGDPYNGTLRLVGADTSRHQCEGPVLARVAGVWGLLASDGDARRYPVYDLEMNHVKDLDAPYPTNIPHPQLVTIDHPPPARQLMITFDGTPFGDEVLGYGSHGDVVIMEQTKQA